MKEKTEVILLEEEILVEGISLCKSGLPMSFDSLGTLWEMYGEKYRGKEKNATSPKTEYAACINEIPDYIAGCAVSVIQCEQAEFSGFVIPKGWYIKDTFSASTFEDLVYKVLTSRDITPFASKHNLQIDPRFYYEAYPQEEFAKGNYQMYTLTPIIQE